MNDSSLNALVASIADGVTMKEADVALLTLALIDEAVDAAAKKAVLVALHARGETPAEIAMLAAQFRTRAVQPSERIKKLADTAIDFVGTGGDRSNAFNISTAVCFILASCGVRVMKHGNRGATTPSGTADIQEVLGFRWDRSEDELADLIEKTGFGFFFAPSYHPAFKHIVPVRKALAAEGKLTVFNVLGPLIHPAQPKYQVLGVYAASLVEPIGRALQQLDRARAFVVHGTASSGEVVDKAITSGSTQYFGVGELSGREGVWSAGDFDLPETSFGDVVSGSPEENAERLQQLFSGKDSGGLLDTVLLNAGIGLYVAERVDSIAAGIAYARDAMDAGQVSRWMESARAAHQG
ncbi:MAG: anthranilate phosphoribosyltransferase [Opitutales bacterium]|nr:anthranilate phosphoribosyltransferase [Opitutales bacterium]